MDRDKFSISVVPDPTNRASNGPQAVPDPSAEWDAKWLRPNVTSMQPPPRPIPAPPTSHFATPSRLAQIPALQRRHQPVRDPLPDPVQQSETESQQSDKLSLRVLRWLFPDVNQRRAKRFPTPGLVAYYWTGGAPYSYQVGDISATGLFLFTRERWAPGTVIQITLQQQDGRINNADTSICVLSEVVRWGENGAGFNFVLSDYENIYDYGMMPNDTIDRKSVERFIEKIGFPVAR